MDSRIASRVPLCGLNIPILWRKSSSSRLASAWRAVLLLGALPALILTALQPAHAQTETVLYSFASTPDGALPNARLTWEGTDLYGTASSNGANYNGAVFELSPQPAGGCPSGTNPGNGWCETVIYSFCSQASCTDGAFPDFSYLLLDNSGNLYGTTYQGGTYNYGTVFELSPEPLSGCQSGSNPGNGWCEIVLYSFQGTSIFNPVNGLVWDQSGDLYGLTYSLDSPVCVASPGYGCAFELSPNGMGGWTEQTIYDIDTNYGGLSIDASGNLYGTDYVNHVFKLSLVEGVWTLTYIHTFTGAPKDGSDTSGAPTPVVDSAGNVYGTTEEGGSKNLGTVWKLTPVTTGKDKGTYKEKILHSFTSDKTGYYPYAGVTLDSSGNIYGTTQDGGKYGQGTVFELAVSGSTYKYKLLWSFNGTDGSNPETNPILDSSGNLYGTTYGGGSNGYGTVYEVKP